MHPSWLYQGELGGFLLGCEFLFSSQGIFGMLRGRVGDIGGGGIGGLLEGVKGDIRSTF